MNLAFMFPGQSSRSLDMFERLERVALSATRSVLSEASEILGRDLRSHYRTDNPDQFATNHDIQLAVFLANHSYYQALSKSGVRADRSLGLSLGEYNHLVHIGALSFSEAVRLIDLRGRAYDAGPRGAMASVFPIDTPELESVLARARAHGVLEIAIFNSPRQFVIAGDQAAVAAAIEIFESEHFVHAVVIEPNIPMHSSCFRPVGEAFRMVLDTADWRAPEHPYLPNVLGHSMLEPGPHLLVDLLARHVWQAVRWRASIDHLVQTQPDLVFLEVGPGQVLVNLLRREWHTCPRLKTDVAAGLSSGAADAEAFERLLDDLRDLIRGEVPVAN